MLPLFPLSPPESLQKLLRTLDIPYPEILLQLIQRPHYQLPFHGNLTLTTGYEQRERERRILAVGVERGRPHPVQTAVDGFGFGKIRETSPG